MNRIIATTLLFAAACAGVIAMAQDDKEPKQPELPAKKVKEAPELKAELDETWKSAEAVTIKTGYTPQKAGPEVELRALHDGTHIWLMARWQDDEKSETKKAWEFKDGGWSQSEGDEDRFAVAINNNVEAFGTEGCMALCHEGSMTTNVEGQTADLWHWKAARGGQNGFADDQHINGEVEGRQNDAGKSAYSSNANEDKTAPKWVWADKADQDGAFTAESAVELPADFKPDNGYRVPAYILRSSEESRGDVEAAAEYKDGWWTVVLKRKLDTGNEDDAALKPGEPTHIAIAVFNNTGAKTGKEHSKSWPLKLTLE